MTSDPWDETTITQLVDRVQDPDRDRFFEQVRRTGHCHHPIRLRSTAVPSRTGRILMIRCRNRRESVCPSCSWEYQGDIWQLLFAGVAGGRKGLPETIATHPMVFATLTAPGFGAVHGRHPGGCRQPRRRRYCRHGRPNWCDADHDDGDAALGDPLCPECYRYQDAVRFNWHAPELWRRFTIQTRRSLARVSRDSGQPVRLSYAKVVEFQRRGVVHIHAIVRADACTDELTPPTAFPAELLVDAITDAAQAVQIDVQGHTLRFGPQLDVAIVATGGTGATPEAVAAYLAKYATKAADELGLSRRLRDLAQLEALQLRPHLRRMVETAWCLGDREPNMRKWAHALGYRGHFATKSRRYSTTLTALRQARAEHQRQRDDAADCAPPIEWRYDGAGYLTKGDAAFARAAAAHERERRHLRHLDKASRQ